MDDLISRQDLMNTLHIKEDCQDCEYSQGIFCTQSPDFVNACEAICDAPPVEVPDSDQMANVIEYYRKKCRSYEETIFKLTNIINQLNRRMEEDDLQGEMKDDA